jgi:hypothetical protein
MDPDFLEYDPNAGCDDGSCQTIIVFGCLDTIACNYDPLANFNVQQLCCYGPDSCTGLDVSIVCPDVSVDEASEAEQLTLHPNPAEETLFITSAELRDRTATVRVLDATGRTFSVPTGTWSHGSLRLDVAGLPPGLYLAMVTTADRRWTMPFIRAGR